MTAEIVCLDDYRRALAIIAERKRLRGLGTVFGSLARDQYFIMLESCGGHPNQIFLKVDDASAQLCEGYGTLGPVLMYFSPAFPVELIARKR